jgi:hypothetical protein
MLKRVHGEPVLLFNPLPASDEGVHDQFVRAKVLVCILQRLMLLPDQLAEGEDVSVVRLAVKLVLDAMVFKRLRIYGIYSASEKPRCFYLA